MSQLSHGLRAGEPVALPSGDALLVIERTRLSVLGQGAWRSVIAQREPHAVLLRRAEGTLSVLAAGAAPVSMAALRDALPCWEHVLGQLASAARPQPSVRGCAGAAPSAIGPVADASSAHACRDDYRRTPWTSR